jgi:hypothetical protein
MIVFFLFFFIIAGINSIVPLKNKFFLNLDKLLKNLSSTLANGVI